MSTMYGADVAELRSLAAKFAHAADQLDYTRMAVGNAIQISAWAGPFAAHFRIQWDSDHSLRVHSAAELLRSGAHALRRNADEQNCTSAVDSTGGYAPYAPPRGLKVALTSTTEDKVPRGANTPADLINQFSMNDGYPADIAIRTIRHEDGTLAHIIYIPGTQDWWSQDSRVMDGIDNIAASTGGDTPTARAVREAMRQHGIGPDDPVLFVGHSQGGLVAGNLAANQDFRSNYNVEGVLAFGAQIDDRSIPSSVVVTQVINRVDIVPRVTGGPMTGVENLNRIDFTRLDVQTPHQMDTSILGRIANADEALTKAFTSPVGEHVDMNGYAGATYDWYFSHRDKWKEEYLDFIPMGSPTAVSRYSALE